MSKLLYINTLSLVFGSPTASVWQLHFGVITEQTNFYDIWESSAAKFVTRLALDVAMLYFNFVFKFF
jgi:hypothetical protein